MLRAIYKCGSACILPTPKDEDYIYYYDTNEERLEALKKNHNHSVDNHYRIWGSEPKVFLGCYIYPFMEKIDGEDIDFQSFDIFDEKIKEQYFEVINRNIEHFKKEDKRWYHIVIAYYMYKNEQMKLTSQQKEVAQNTHDRGISDTMYNKVIDYFKK